MTQRISVIKGMSGVFEALGAMAGEAAARIVLPGHPKLPKRSA